MAWKFYNVGKANAEIERLEAEVATLKAQLADAVVTPEEITKHAEAMAAANADLTAKLADVSAKLGGATLARVALETAVSTHAETLAAKDAEVERLAAAKALEITQKQGQPPIPADAQEAQKAQAKQELKGLARTTAALKAEYSQTK
jgi:chromosome segregation ATPase